MSKPIIVEDGHPDKITVWTEPRGCSSCKHCGMDMDMDPYCGHPAVLKSYQYGVSINFAIQHFCGNPHTLWRKK